MELKVYKLTATSELYKTNYTIRAKDLQDASKQAKIKFAKQYKVFGNNVKIGLQHCDIDEILSKLHN